MTVQLADADAVLVSSKSWFGRLLKWAQTEKGEVGRAGHAAMVFCMTEERRWFLVNEARLEPEQLPAPGEWCVIEAHYFVRVLSWSEFVYQRRKDQVGVVNYAPLDAAARERMVRHALTYAGEPYSVRRLVVMGWAKLFGNRADLKVKGDKPVCSYIWGKPAFIETGIRIKNKSYKELTPDDIGDAGVNKYPPGFSIQWL